MKKFCIGILVLSMLFGCSFVPVLSARDEGHNTYAMRDDTFTVNITISNVTDLAGWQCALTWCNTELNCTGATIYDPSSWKGSISILKQANNSYTATEGYFFNAQAMIGGTGGDVFNGTVTVATLTFYVLGFNSTNTLSVSDVGLCDSSGNDIATLSYITTTSSSATVHIDAVPSTNLPVPVPTNPCVPVPINLTEPVPTNQTIEPLSLNVTIDGTNVCDAGGTLWFPSGIVNVTATTEKADNCILSYTFMCWDNNGALSPINDGTVWINVTMTRNGDSFSGIIDLNTTAWGAWHATCDYTVTANDIHGHSSKASGDFINFFDDP